MLAASAACPLLRAGAAAAGLCSLAGQGPRPAGAALSRSRVGHEQERRCADLDEAEVGHLIGAARCELLAIHAHGEAAGVGNLPCAARPELQERLPPGHLRQREGRELLRQIRVSLGRVPIRTAASPEGHARAPDEVPATVPDERCHCPLGGHVPHGRRISEVLEALNTVCRRVSLSRVRALTLGFLLIKLNSWLKSPRSIFLSVNTVQAPNGIQPAPRECHSRKTFGSGMARKRSL
mmetsp:Transcript_21857/g.52214  ORF Transcript_21857/g.52214 Transcript_21857/m.52214 type:complete len:237 (+) Transcript_21857:166-876(+)